MPSSYTSSLRLTLPATGELSGQWGSVVNQGITELLDAAVAGTAAISTWGGAGIAYTLSNNSGLADEARKMFIVATGSPGEAKNVICPAVSKFYVLRNDTTGGFGLTLKTPSGTGISVPAGQYKFLYCDGTDVVEMFNSAGALTLGGALSVGGTTTLASNPTLSAGVANGVTYLNGSKVLTSGSALTFDGTNFGLGTNTPAAVGTTLAIHNSADSVLRLTNTTTGQSATNGFKLQANGTDAYLVNYSNGFMAFYTNATEQMRLTSTGLGIGTSSPARPLDVRGSLGMQVNEDGVGTKVISLRSNFAGAGPAINVTTNDPLLFLTNNTEQMRLTSTGLGIGTSSLSYTAAGRGNVNIAGSSGAILGFQIGGAAKGYVFHDSTLLQVWNETGGIILGTAGTTKATLDASGNLGLGVTPSAWSAFKAFDLFSSLGASLASTGGSMQLGMNFYYNGTNYVYKGTGFATRYEQLGGGSGTSSHAWYTAPSGTAGNAISFTQAMTLDSSGNLGLGVTPSAWASSAAGYSVMQIRNAAFYGISTNIARMSANAFVDGSGVNTYINNGFATRHDQQDGEFRWLTAPNNTSGAGAGPISFTQAMTLDASGNLGVGTTSPATKLHVSSSVANATVARFEGAYSAGNAVTLASFVRAGAAVEGVIRYREPVDTIDFGTATNHPVAFLTNNTECARITSGGDLLVGTTSAVGGSAPRFVAKGPATANQQVGVFWNPATTATQYFLSFGTDTTYTERGYITWNGTTTAIANASDQRLKKNIGDAPSALAKINAVKVRSFDFIADGRHVDYGVIAQELEQVVPAAVFKGADAEDGSIDKPWSVGLEPLIPVLVKAIQEQQALITALTARVQALETP